MLFRHPCGIGCIAESLRTMPVSNFTTGVGVDLILVFVIVRLAVVAEMRDVEFVNVDERAFRHALVHDDVARFESRTGRMTISLHSLLGERRIDNRVRRVQFVARFVLLVETLHMTAPHHLWCVLFDVFYLHLLKQMLLLRPSQCGVRVNLVELICELHLLRKIAWVPIARQAVENSTIACQHKQLNIVRTGSVACSSRLPLALMPAGSSNITLIGYVCKTADKVVLEVSESWFLREAHGPQAIAGASSGTG